MKLTPQEKNIVDFLVPKREAFWEELAKFCKEPSKVKLRTVQKIVSDIKKKHKDEDLQCPFDCKFSYLSDPKNQEITPASIFKAAEEKITFNGQQLVKLIRPIAPIDPRKACQIDFTIKKYQNQVVTKSGVYNLSDDDFQVFEYFYNNPEKIVSLEELRDQVVFPKYGSKLPAKWFFSIQRRINNVRRTVPELKNRILTMKLDNNGTGYFFR